MNKKTDHYSKITLVAVLIGLALGIGLAGCAAPNKEDDAVSVVKANLAAKKNNDYDAWKATLWSAVKEGQDFAPSFEKPGDLGVLRLTIEKIAVSEQETSRIRQMYTGSELAQTNGWTDAYLAENMIAVYAQYTVDYDNTKVPYEEGDLAQYFYLIRQDKDSPWLIWDSMGTSLAG